MADFTIREILEATGGTLYAPSDFGDPVVHGFTIDTRTLTPGMGYVYDWDPTREKRPNTMLPAGDRHNIYFGATFHITDNLDFTLAGGMVLMESKTALFDNPVTGQKDAFKFQSRNSHTYLASASLTYHF